MTQEMLERLKTIDLAVLTHAVRQDLHSPSFKLTDWSVKRLSDKGAMNPDGLWLINGVGTDSEGLRSWAMVVKVLLSQEQEIPPGNIMYWKREFLLAQSGLAEHLPGPVKAPRFYRVEETHDGAWIWMEQVENSRPGTWGIEDYAFAARQLGHWNGMYVTGSPLPDEPWLARQHYRSVQYDINPELIWQFPLHQKHVSAEIRLRFDRLWAERETFFRVIEAMPQVFSHFDSQRRNLIIRKDKNGKDELVLLDWSMCGPGALGGELCSFVGWSVVFIEWPSSKVAQLDEAAFTSYLQGLRDAGWSGNADLVRLGYLSWQAMFLGSRLPSLFSLLCSSEDDVRISIFKLLGLAEEELYLNWLPLLDYSLGCADEARHLMRKLQFI
jgi:hypothetical protein